MSRATILSAPAAGGRCSAGAISHGAFIHISLSPSSSKRTGVASGWIGATSGLVWVVRKLKARCLPTTGMVLVPVSPSHSRQIPAKNINGRLSFWATHVQIERGPWLLLGKAGHGHKATLLRLLELGLPITVSGPPVDVLRAVLAKRQTK